MSESDICTTQNILYNSLINRLISRVCKGKKALQTANDLYWKFYFKQQICINVASDSAYHMATSPGHMMYCSTNKILHCSCSSDIGEFSIIIMHFQIGSDILISPFSCLL